jgi:hypothetical protein
MLKLWLEDFITKCFVGSEPKTTVIDYELALIESSEEYSAETI